MNRRQLLRAFGAATAAGAVVQAEAFSYLIRQPVSIIVPNQSFILGGDFLFDWDTRRIRFVGDGREVYFDGREVYFVDTFYGALASMAEGESPFEFKYPFDGRLPSAR